MLTPGVTLHTSIPRLAASKALPVSGSPTFSGSARKVHFGAAQDPASVETATTPEVPQKKLGAFKTYRVLKRHLTDAGNRDVLIGLGYKFGPDLILPAVFAIPVVGWAAGLAGIPVAWWSNRHGEKIIDQLSEKDQLSKDNAFHQGLEFHKIWNGPPVEKKAEQLADRFNNIIDALFPDDGQDEHTSLLRKTLRMTKNAKQSKAFWLLNRLVDAQQYLKKIPIVSTCINGLDKVFDLLTFIPRPLRTLMLIPKFALMGLFVTLGCKP